MTSPAAHEFHAAMLRGADQLKREIGYNPYRFQQMIAERGGVAAAKRLLGRGSATSEGFTTLWEARRLTMSVEAFALLPWYAPLFTEDELATARQRLEAHGFDVDRFLQLAAEEPPGWYRPHEPQQ